MARIPAIESSGNRDAEYLPLAAGQTFAVGAAIVLDGSKNVTECGVDPASIYGFALVSCVAGVSKDPQDSTYILAAKAIEGEKFWMQCNVAPVLANRNNSYGITKDADGIWYVDFTKTVATRVYVHRIDVDTQRVEVSILAANRQLPP